MTRNEILVKANEIVTGEREQDYGSPEQNFETIARMWSAYLDALPVSTGYDGMLVHSEDVAAMMALLKIARIAAGRGKADNWIDLAGYAACGGELEG